MSKTAKLVMELLQQQMKIQREQTEAQIQAHTKQTEAIIATLTGGAAKWGDSTPKSFPSFVSFDTTSGLWTYYWARFQTFVATHSIPDDKKAQVFLTNQSLVTFITLSNLASQLTPPKDVNELTFDEIATFMKNQFVPTRYVIRERFKFWSNMLRKPGETVQELAARIRQDAVTCDFASIKDPLDEALRTRFICSINNEAVLKALFKVKDSDLTFAKAITIAMETEDASKVAKETVYGNKSGSVHKVQYFKKQADEHSVLKPKFKSKDQKRRDFAKGVCRGVERLSTYLRTVLT